MRSTTSYGAGPPMNNCPPCCACVQESLIAGQRGRDDVLNSVLAGTGAGVLYKVSDRFISI